MSTSRDALRAQRRCCMAFSGSRTGSTRCRSPDGGASEPMSLVVDRRLSLLDRLYLPGIFRGMRITLKHLFKRKFTMQYPEQRWTFPDGFRGVPALVKDQEGRVKCVACYLCPVSYTHLRAHETPE